MPLSVHLRNKLHLVLNKVVTLLTVRHAYHNDYRLLCTTERSMTVFT